MPPIPLFHFEVRDLRDALNILAAMITPALMYVASIVLINEARQAVHNADEETEYILALAARHGLSADPSPRPPAASGR
jgi:hypothetical protein